jgi:hypothetical protein
MNFFNRFGKGKPPKYSDQAPFIRTKGKRYSLKNFGEMGSYSACV